MKFLHFQVEVGAGGLVEVELDGQANVRLMDSHNFAHYRAGRRHRFQGGLAKSSPVRLGVPHGGSWHVVVDLGGYAGHIGAKVRALGAGAH